jgi:hypothetical protein
VLDQQHGHFRFVHPVGYCHLESATASSAGVSAADYRTLAEI